MEKYIVTSVGGKTRKREMSDNQRKEQVVAVTEEMPGKQGKKQVIKVTEEMSGNQEKEQVIEVIEEMSGNQEKEQVIEVIEEMSGNQEKEQVIEVIEEMSGNQEKEQVIEVIEEMSGNQEKEQVIEVIEEMSGNQEKEQVIEVIEEMSGNQEKEQVVEVIEEMSGNQGKELVSVVIEEMPEYELSKPTIIAETCEINSTQDVEGLSGLQGYVRISPHEGPVFETTDLEENMSNTLEVDSDATDIYDTGVSTAVNSKRKRENGAETTPKRRKTFNYRKGVIYDSDSESNLEMETPRKSPGKRKRRSDPSKWKKTLRKTRRNLGLDYVNSKGTPIHKKEPRYITCKCKYQCSSFVTPAIQKDIFKQYWETGEYRLQRQFIHDFVKREKVKRRTTQGNSRREFTFKYFLPINKVKTQVCKKMFLATFSIKQRTIFYTMKKEKEQGNQENVFVPEDRRGKQTVSKIPKKDQELVRNHIRSFPVLDSHYSRLRSKRRYLAADLNVSKMYREYVKMTKKKRKPRVKQSAYLRIFNSDFNLGFHVPKKDTCGICNRYKNLSEKDKAKPRERKNYGEHQKRKEEARLQKDDDKERAKRDENVRVLCFDMQKCLMSPKCNVSELYYSRKLATYNLTSFDVASKKATCYMWHEAMARRGSCEIASCMFKENKQAAEKGIKEMVYYSDTCALQQRNVNFSAMCLWVKILCHAIFVRLVTADRGGSKMGAIMLCLTEKCHLEPFFLI